MSSFTYVQNREIAFLCLLCVFAWECLKITLKVLFVPKKVAKVQ